MSFVNTDVATIDQTFFCNMLLFASIKYLENIFTWIFLLVNVVYNHIHKQRVGLLTIKVEVINH